MSMRRRRRKSLGSGGSKKKKKEILPRVDFLTEEKREKVIDVQGVALSLFVGF